MMTMTPTEEVPVSVVPSAYPAAASNSPIGTRTQIGATRVAGLDLDSARIRAALAAVLAMAPAPAFTVADLAAKVADMTGHTDYTVRQATYDLRKLRGKDLVTKPGRTRRYQVPLRAARTIAALLTLRDHVIAPILAGVRGLPLTS